MALHQVFLRYQCDRVLFTGVFIFIILAMVLFSGCTGQQDNTEKNFTGKTPGQLTATPAKDCIPTPTSPITRHQSYNLMFSDFHGFLVEWNKAMEWNFSDQQIEEFNHTLRCGRLMKYQVPGRNGVTGWRVVDIYEFCMDVGDEMGLTTDQSEFFAASADDYFQRSKVTFHGAVPTKHVILFDRCNVSIERGKQVQINMTYRYAWDDDPPEIVRFNTKQAPLTVAYLPSEITPVKPFREYPAVALITTDPTLKPGQYTYRISIEGKNQTEISCRDTDSGTYHQNNMYATII